MVINNFWNYFKEVQADMIYHLMEVEKLCMKCSCQEIISQYKQVSRSIYQFPENTRDKKHMLNEIMELQSSKS